MQRQEFVIGGFTERGRENGSIGGLLLGYYDDRGRLACAGSMGTGKGWTAAFLRELRAGLEQFRQPACPFEPALRGELGRTGRWVRPALVVEVQFLEWTADGSIRHPGFCGFRGDIRAQNVRRESGAALRP